MRDTDDARAKPVWCLPVRPDRGDGPLRDLVRRGVLTDHHGPDATRLTYFTGYSYDTLYDWDQYFETLVQLYLGLPCDLALNGVRIFLSRQHDNGFIARSVPSTPTHDHEHVKPFLAQIVLLCHRGWSDGKAAELLAEPGFMAALKKYLAYWLEDSDAGGAFEGLSVWQSAPHTGMDNQHERAGGWRDAVSVGVDLNCYLVRELRATADLCDLVDDDEAGRFRELAADRATRIAERLWDDEAGFFFDGNARAGQAVWSRSAPRGSVLWNPRHDRLIRVESVSGFAPLFAGVASEEQVRRLVDDHLLDPTRFWTPAPVPALSRREPGYVPEPLPGDVGCCWRANTWLPTNYMLAHGLRRYGYDRLADTLARKTHAIMAGEPFREYHASETGQGQGLDPFWGWTVLAHFLPDEGPAEAKLNLI